MRRQLVSVGVAICLGLPVVAMAGDPPALRQGIANYNKGYIAKALPLFEQAAKQAPNNPAVYVWLARAYQKQGGPANLEKAQRAFRQVLALQPNNVEALTSLGEVLSWNPATREEAIGMLQRAYGLKAEPATARKLADALFWSGRSAEALQYAAPILGTYKNDRAWLKNYAQMLAQGGNPAAAIELYSTTLAGDLEKDPNLKLQYALALMKDGQTQKAQAVFEQVSNQAQGSSLANNPDFMSRMAALAFDLGLYAESVRWDTALPESHARNKDIQLRTARALAKVFRVPEAIERFHHLYEAGLLNADEKLEYADYIRLLNLQPDAMPQPGLVEQLYKEALQERPQDGDVAMRLARLYGEDESRFEEAVAAYRHAMTLTLADPITAKKEFLDFVKSYKADVGRAEQILTELMAESPDDLITKAGYAEFLSWQPDRRPESMRLYVEIARTDTANADLWESKLDEVLRWHKPTTDLIPLYQEIVDRYPANKTIWLTVARAYRDNPDYYKEAVETYGRLVQRFPDDATVKREWLGLLVSNEAERGNNIKLLAKMTQENPGDLDVWATYAKLLSYDAKYEKALGIFDNVLSQNPEHREALVGKGYALMWSGRKFKAKEYLEGLRAKYPDDVDIAVALASAEKSIGRYDEAFRIIQEIKPLLEQRNPEAGWWDDTGVRPVAHWEEHQSLLISRAVSDFSILPYSQPAVAAPEPAPAPESDTPPVPEEPVAMPAVVEDPAVQALKREVHALTEAVKSLEALRESSRAQLDQLEKTVQSSRDKLPGELSYMEATTPPADNRTVGAGGMTPVYGTYSALDYDTNPLLSGLGRFRNDELADLERGLINDMRPMLRTGYVYSTQDGDPDTTKWSLFGFPTQLGLSVTPQMRIRLGMNPAKYYLDEATIEPDSNWGIEYGFGATLKYWDRLTLDGDFAVTHFTQTDNANIIFQTQAEYAFNDAVRAKLGARRLPLYNSLLSIAGQKPHVGAFRDEVLGQARENGFYAELNTNPFSPKWDLNLGYEWAFVTGHEIPTNYKNQAFLSTGYTWRYHPRHQLRLGYEFLYFGYSKNATNGFFDVTRTGIGDPVVLLDPVVLANEGYDFGGYFSPEWFIMNSGRLDFRGSLFNKFIEYKLGGALGVQAFGLGHGIDGDEPSDAALASAFDANVIMNFTDWLAAYGNVDFLDAGGNFNRWRFGGGLILRPHIAGLSPIIGGPSNTPAADTAPRIEPRLPSESVPEAEPAIPTWGDEGIEETP